MSGDPDTILKIIEDLLLFVDGLSMVSITGEGISVEKATGLDLAVRLAKVAGLKPDQIWIPSSLKATFYERMGDA